MPLRRLGTLLAASALLISISSSRALADGYTFTSFFYPGSVQTYAYGINSYGQIVGNASNGNGFIYSGGNFATIDVPNALQTNPVDINNIGMIVGWDIAPGEEGNDAFLYSGGNFTTIDDPNAVSYTNANGINDSGEIVGTYGGGSVEHGFLDIGGNFTTLDHFYS